MRHGPSDVGRTYRRWLTWPATVTGRSTGATGGSPWRRLATASRTIARNMDGDIAREGVDAFLAKIPPNWKP